MAAVAKKKSQNKGLGSKGLGRGLDALLGDAPSAKTPARDKRELPIEFLIANPDQPRRVFDKDAISELAASIKSRGLLQPILVRQTGEKTYEIVAGERRWRAAQKAKLHSVPVVIRELTDEEAAEIALIENVQRVDLGVIEEATAYQRLADAYDRTHDEIAKAVGKSRSHVANTVRLLKLPAQAIEAVTSGAISMGHARALLGCSDPSAALKAVLKDDLSVRETEALARAGAPAKSRKISDENAKKDVKTVASGARKDADTRALERDLSNILGLEVDIDHSKKGAGDVTISYRTLDQLDDICRRLMGAGV